MGNLDTVDCGRNSRDEVCQALPCNDPVGRLPQNAGTPLLYTSCRLRSPVCFVRPIVLEPVLDNSRSAVPAPAPAIMALLRPSTSGGLSTKDSAYDVSQQGANNFDKRMSKDDMFFGTAGRNKTNNNFTGGDKRTSRDDMYIRSRMAAMSQFHVPVRGSTITPQHSPDYPVPHEVSIPIRMQTPESMTSGEIPIGMALGSPVHVTQEQSRWQAQFPPASPRAASPQVISPQPATPQTSMASEPSPGLASIPPGGSLQRKKTGRRKLFGLFGGRKNADGDRDSTPSVSTDRNAGSRAPTRSNTQSEKKASKHKPVVSRSNTMPYGTEDELSPQMVTSGPLNLQAPRLGPSSRPGNNYFRPDLPRAPPAPSGPSFLDVQIPDTKLERYSVMFSDVLNPGGTKNEPAVSLLARRQATLERLKSINNRIEAEEAMKEAMRPRRATSPQPQPSPRLSIFPSPPSNRNQPAIDTPTTLSRIARSNTSPGRLPSPTQPTFDKRAPPLAQLSTRNLTVPNPFEMHPPPSREGPIYPTDTSFHFGTADQPGFVVIDSPTAVEPEEDHDIVIAQPMKPTLHEPQWQMVSPSTTSSVMSSSALSGRPARSPSISSSSTHMTKPSTDSKFEEADAAFQSAVEVSIARQISISRQQRQLLRPLQTRRRTESGSGAGAGVTGPSPRSAISESRSPLGVTVIKSPSPTNRFGREESLREIQTSTPTLVHPRNSPINPEHRKSSYVMVESD